MLSARAIFPLEHVFLFAFKKKIIAISVLDSVLPFDLLQGDGSDSRDEKL